MPLVLPLASIFVVVLVALNISRLFLAGGKTQSAAVIVATVITVGILVGASALAAAKHMRTSSLVLGLSLVLVLVFSAGLITFGSGEEKKNEASGPAAPTGPAVNTLAIDALPTLSFQATEFTVPAGINEIEYVDKGGTHTLVFADPKLGYFNLGVPAGPTKGKVDTRGRHRLHRLLHDHRSPRRGDAGHDPRHRCRGCAARRRGDDHHRSGELTCSGAGSSLRRHLLSVSSSVPPRAGAAAGARRATRSRKGLRAPSSPSRRRTSRSRPRRRPRLRE